MSRLAEQISSERPALKAFMAELDRTGVISDDFKNELYVLCTSAVREAYYLGRDSVRNETHDVEADVQAEFWVHGTPATSFSQVADYLESDAHDRSKVQVRIGARGGFGRFFNVGIPS